MGCQEVSRREIKQSPPPVLASHERLEQPMEIEMSVPSVESKAPAPTPKKKTKKASYKSMIAAMTKPTGDRDIEKEKEQLRKVTGGGAFTKIDKI